MSQAQDLTDLIRAAAGSSPIVTIEHLAAAAELIIERVQAIVRVENRQPKKIFESVSGLQRLTGLSRNTIATIIHKNPKKIRFTYTPRPGVTSPLRYYHVEDFLTVSSIR